MTRVAAIDCGTNSIRLLVADAEPGARELRELDRTMQIVRLGEGVDATGRLAAAALQRTFAACDVYAAVLAEREVERVRFVATSATRDAENREEFIDGVRARLGVEPEVVTGAEEAALSFSGATRGFLEDGPYLVVDIGGGSTELVHGTERPDAACSMDIGCVRLTERHLHDDPPTTAQIDAAVADIDGALAEAARSVPLDASTTLLGLAGSVTTVAGIALELPAYDPVQIHHSRIPAAVVEAVSERLLAATRAERAAMPVMHPGRVDVIGAGALILARLLVHTGSQEVVVSEHDILDGIAWSLVQA